MNTNFAIAENLESSAEWRREKAVEFPDDASRNNAASDELEALAVLFRNDDTDFDLLAAYEELFDENKTPLADPVLATEALGRIVNAVGFHRSFDTAEDFLQAVIDSAKQGY